MMPTYFGEQRKKEICRLLGQRYRLFLLLGIILILSSSSSAQVETATVSGVITDQSGGVVVGAEVRVTNVDTNVTSTTTSNRSGVYLVTGLKPGRYRIKVKKEGFKGIDLTDLVLNVQASINRNFALELGSVSESISVEGGVSLVNTTDASVGTVVDRKYVENMPLNGRSFQDLILLTPGIVTNTPQLGPAGAPGVGTRGEFNVNGQRTESNYYMVDGASANVGIVPGGTTFSATSGSLPGSTALGTTQALVSVDALEEFRVQTSTYSAEYGRNPGAQFSFVTRSGTNQWHGTAFDYLRNDYFDANNWFNNFFGKREPPLRQNDFGGTLGGPVKLPKLYSERDKTFFFFSYEGLRVLLPQAATLNYVPDTGLRQSARAPLQAVMNAFPRQNGPEALDSMGNPTGMAEFIAAWSNPSSLDAYSIRLDHNFGDRLRLFFRFSDTPSSGNSRLTGGGGTPSVVQTFKFTPRTYTLGATSVFSSRLNNEFRFNYSSNLAEVLDTLDNFGGAQPINLAQLQQIAPSSYEVDAGLVGFSGFTAQLTQKQVSGLQRQWNVTDSLSLLLGRHQLKFGIDYRRIAPVQKPGLVAGYNFFSQNDVQTNNPGFVLASNQVSAYPLYTNFSAFAQDEWRVTPKLSITMGLRWEVNPAPGVTQGILPRPVVGNSLATLMLAPQGTPLWKTGWYNFAPRLGAAYILRGVPGWETVMRGGAGLFFDTGQQLGSMGYAGPGFANNAAFGYASPSGVPVSFPIPPAQIPPPTSIPTPPYNATGFAFPTHYQLPYTLQWNVAVEQALGKSQSLSTTYVGSHAARLLEVNLVNISAVNPNFPRDIEFFPSGTADYDALQVQFQRRFTHGLTALASYTLSHSLDYGSQDNTQPYIRGNSNFDVRQNFTSAFSYDLPNFTENRVARAVLHHWGLDDRFSARTGYPVTLDGRQLTNPVTGQVSFTGVNLNPGVPLYLTGSACAGCPGGKRINPAAFSFPAAGQLGNAPRNFVRGLGVWQMDLAVRREFPIRERLKLQFRAEAFNVFNHPNFGNIEAHLQRAKTTFGEPIATVNTSLGTLNPLYQMGGPRSMQFALKLIF